MAALLPGDDALAPGALTRDRALEAQGAVQISVPQDRRVIAAGSPRHRVITPIFRRFDP